MPTCVIEPAPVMTLPIQGSGAVFPVRRVYGIGRNCAAHANEMGHDPNREPPFFFQKNPDKLHVGDTFSCPAQTSDVHHEVEMIVALQSGGTDIPPDRALDHVCGCGVGLDTTRCDLQGKAREMGRPWESGKAFENSAPASALRPVSDMGHPAEGLVQLEVNVRPRQTGDLNQMIWTVPEMISYLSDCFELAGGDVIMTGTPAGVGAVVRGDVMEGHVAGVGDLTVTVV